MKRTTSSNLSFAAIILAVILTEHCAQGGIIFTTLASFDSTNGAAVNGGLVEGDDGNFYGLTSLGGSTNLNPLGQRGFGTVFRIAPDGALTNVVVFNGSNGWYPAQAFIKGTDGRLYGSTVFGGPYQNVFGNSLGTVFRVSLDGTFETLAYFDGTNGVGPAYGLVESSGSFYGVTPSGGTNSPGRGNVFRMTTNGVLTNVVWFKLDTNGYYPGALIRGANGEFYGVNSSSAPNPSQGGAHNGTVFKVTPAGVATTLAWFNGTNGDSPGSLVLASDGNLYGTTSAGGIGYTGTPQTGYGTVFRLAPNGTLTTLALFNSTNGSSPSAPLIQATDGCFYGMTAAGGASDQGTVFKITPGGVLTTLVEFDGSNGSSPTMPLLQASDGALYGATYWGGEYFSTDPPDRGYGTVFRISVPMTPTFTSISQSNGELKLKWSSVAGQIYQLEYSTNLSGGDWNNLGSSFVATNGTTTTFDTVEIGARRFYRVAVLP